MLQIRLFFWVPYHLMVYHIHFVWFITSQEDRLDSGTLFKCNNILGGHRKVGGWKVLESGRLLN